MERPSTPRLVQLDAARGLAAMLVVFSHITVLLPPHIVAATLNTVQYGHLGVAIFFLCSGYLIPTSLERHGSLPQFWLKRIFRLFPLYWLTLALALMCYRLGWITEWITLSAPEVRRLLRDDPLRLIGWHLPMWQWWAGVPHLLNLYWTLVVEEAFYLLVAALFRIGWLRHTRVVAIACFVLTVAGDPFFTLPWGTYFTMLWAGRIIFCARTGTLGRRPALYLLAASALVVTVPLHPYAITSHAMHTPEQIARLLAFPLFGAILAIPPQRVPRFAVYLGVISYSLYLLHPLILASIPQLPALWQSTVVWLGALIGCAALTERYVERVGINVGRRLSAHLRQRPAVLAENPSAPVFVDR